MGSSAFGATSPFCFQRLEFAFKMSPLDLQILAFAAVVVHRGVEHLLIDQLEFALHFFDAGLKFGHGQTANPVAG